MSSSANLEPSVFSKIISGEFPGRFVYADDTTVAFLTIAPQTIGHTLVVPRQQVDKWTDLTTAQYCELSSVAHRIAMALEDEFECTRVALMIAGMEVPHCHIHVLPIMSEQDMSFARADPNPKPQDLDHAAERIRSALHARGETNVAR